MVENTGLVLAAAMKLRALCDSGSSEEVLHQFLSDNVFLFYNAIGNMAPPEGIYSKVLLGSKYETDFVAYFDKTEGRYWTFIEIERASVPLFNRSGDPSRYLTHAIRQVQDWQAWVADNIAFARTLFSDILEPMGIIVIGRRDTLSANNRRYLRELLRQNRNLEIMTYDRIIDSADVAGGFNTWLAVTARPGKELVHSPPQPSGRSGHLDSERRTGYFSTGRHAELVTDKDGNEFVANPADEFEEEGWLHPW